jgi:hypothetical protein
MYWTGATGMTSCWVLVIFPIMDITGSVLLGGAGNDFYVVDSPDNTEVYDSQGTDTAVSAAIG